MIYVVSFSEKSDEIKDEDGLNCTFKRDISGFEYALNNSLINTDIANMSLEQLLEGFFKFYASLDYNSVTICVVSGILQPKRKSDFRDALDIVNPFDNRNVAANVKREAILRFRRSCIDASELFSQWHYEKKQNPRHRSDLMYLLQKNPDNVKSSKQDYSVNNPYRNRVKIKLPDAADLFDQ